jgi:hypothetical protein
MNDEFTRMSVRSVTETTIEKLNHLRAATRLPMGALIEDAVAILWDQHVEAGFDLPDVDCDSAS